MNEATRCRQRSELGDGAEVPTPTRRHGPGGGRLLRVVGLLAAALMVLGASACGDDDEPDVGEGDIDERAEDVVESAGARAVAETLRGALVAEDLDQGEHARDVAVIEEAVGDLPGEPEVAGVEDGDGDGQDDDGNVEVRVDGESACVSISPNGEVDSTGGAC